MDPREIFGHVFTVESVIAAVVFVLVWTTVMTAVVLSHRRRQAGKPPWRLEKHTALETTYGLAVAAVVGFVVYLSFHSTAQEATGADRPATKVHITAFQWCWRFTYPGTERSASGTCAGGSRPPTMVVPVGKPIQLDIRSTDVIHSWWVPALRYKLDAFPDHTNTVTIKVDKAGRWVGRCAEFCGERHSFMMFYLKAVPADQYRQWLSAAQA